MEILLMSQRKKKYFNEEDLSSKRVNLTFGANFAYAYN